LLEAPLNQNGATTTSDRAKIGRKRNTWWIPRCNSADRRGVTPPGASSRGWIRWAGHLRDSGDVWCSRDHSDPGLVIHNHAVWPRPRLSKHGGQADASHEGPPGSDLVAHRDASEHRRRSRNVDGWPRWAVRVARLCRSHAMKSGAARLRNTQYVTVDGYLRYSDIRGTGSRSARSSDDRPGDPECLCPRFAAHFVGRLQSCDALDAAKRLAASTPMGVARLTTTQGLLHKELIFWLGLLRYWQTTMRDSHGDLNDSVKSMGSLSPPISSGRPLMGVISISKVC
jgi:hypothetical protein